MKRLLAIGLVLGAWPVMALSEDLSVSGNVAASWRNLTAVSSSQDAIVHAGDKVTVTIKGSVDINQETRHETHCDLWVFCKGEDIPVHHFMKPEQVPVQFQVRPVGGGTPVVTAVIGATPVDLTIPPTVANFQTPFEIVALLDGAGTWIDPGRSGQSYDVTLDVDASGRANFFLQWLNQTHPSAAVATDPAAIADDLRTQGSTVAAALRQYAVSNFPVPDVANNTSHERLVRKAVELAPGDVENTLALARYLHAIGLDAQADAALAQAIATLESKGDPRSRRQLGDTYMASMNITLAKGGGVDPATTQAALSYADKAVTAYQQAMRPDLESAAQFARGRLQRGLRTRESLRAAADSLKAALSKAPDILAAEAVMQSADGTKTYSLRLRDAVSSSSLADGPKPTDPEIRDEMPVGWDPGSQRLLVSMNGGMSWLSPRLDAPQAAPALPLGPVQVANGSIARLKDMQGVDYFSKDQIASSLAVGDGTNLTCASDAPTGGPGIRGMSLSPDGATVAVVCNSKLRLFQYSGGSMSRVSEQALPANAIVFGLAGPVTCGTVLITQPYPGHPNINVALQRGGTQLNLVDVPYQPSTFFAADRVTFAGDEVLVAASANAIRRFHCLDGSVAGDVPLAVVPDPGPTQFAGISLHWLSATQVAVVRSWARSVDVITWPALSPTHFNAQADVSSLDLLTQILLPPATAGASPRILRAHRIVDLNAHPAPAGANSVSLDVPGSWEPIVQTADSSHFLVQRAGSPTWIAQNSASPTVSEGIAHEVALDTFGSGSSWIAAKVDARSYLESLLTTDASGSTASIQLPTVPPLYYTNVAPALKTVYDAWKTFPEAPEFPGMFPNRDLPKVISDPSLLTVMYRPLDGGFHVGSAPPPTLVFPAFTPGPLPALSAAQGLAAVTICANAAARPSTGVPSLSIAQSLPDQVFLAVESGGTLVFRAVPEPRLAPIPSPPPPGWIDHYPVCNAEQLVRGASPTVIYWGSLVDGAFKVQILQPGGWVTTNVATPPSAGWSTPDGSVLLLVSDTVAAPGQIAPKSSVLRIKNDGSSAPACALCSGLELPKAFGVLAPAAPSSGPFNIPPSPQTRLSLGGPASLVMVDAKGQILVRPDQDETVVVSMTDGTILRHVPFGKPLFVSEHLLAISAGEERVGFYTY